MEASTVSTTVLLIAVLLLVMKVTPAVRGGSAPQEYLRMRQKLVRADKQKGLGANLTLNPQEQIVDKIILKEKKYLMDPSIYNRTIYSPSLSFYKSKPIMEKTSLFKIIQSMPKGGILHIHDLAMGSLDWLVKNATYRDHIYMCIGVDNLMYLAAFLKPPKNTSGCFWKSVNSQRESFGNIERFDQMLKANLSYLTVDPVQDYLDNDQAWERFYKYFRQVMNVIYYLPVFKDFLWDTLEQMRLDNVQYFEYRGQLHGLFDLDGVGRDAEFGMLTVREVIGNFTLIHPDFIGGKVIMNGYRHESKETVFQEVKTAVMLRQKYPDFFLGNNLVGEEVWYNSLLYYLDALLYPTTLSPPVTLPYYFHAGETDWQETESDYNLVDALLLNTSRIGHGYALTKHPHLAEIARKKQVAVELNPVSNQVLRLVTDLRNHPMTSLMADGFPVVVSSDDPMTWEALPLSHDFFLAFVTMSGRESGLAFLKQLAMNSISYSGMSSTEKVRATKLWQIKWDMFIKQQIMQEEMFGSPQISLGTM